jgi:putative flippase GtrA
MRTRRSQGRDITGGRVSSGSIMTTLAARFSLRERLRSSWRILLKEVGAFGVVGAVGLIVDLGVYNLLLHDGSIKAKTVSTVLATIITNFGNRYWSFSHRARNNIGRETSFFFGINLLWLGVTDAAVAIFSYPLGYRTDRVVLNLVGIAMIAMGTLFRFWAYKRFVFLHPDRVHSHTADLDVELAE